MAVSLARRIRALVFLLAALPFVIGHHARPITTFYPELTAFLIGGAVIGCVSWRHGLSVSLAILSPLIWLLLVLLQFAAGTTPALHDALGFSLFIVWAVLLAAALTRFRAQDKTADLETVFASALVAGGGQCSGVSRAGIGISTYRRFLPV